MNWFNLNCARAITCTNPEMCTINSKNMKSKNSKICYATPKNLSARISVKLKDRSVWPQLTSEEFDPNPDDHVRFEMTSIFRNRWSSTTWFSPWICFWLCDHGWTDWNHCWALLAYRNYQTVSWFSSEHMIQLLSKALLTELNCIFHKTFHFFG